MIWVIVVFFVLCALSSIHKRTYATVRVFSSSFSFQSKCWHRCRRPHAKNTSLSTYDDQTALNELPLKRTHFQRTFVCDALLLLLFFIHHYTFQAFQLAVYMLFLSLLVTIWHVRVAMNRKRWSEDRRNCSKGGIFCSYCRHKIQYICI